MKYKINPIDFNDLVKQDNLSVSISKGSTDSKEESKTNSDNGSCKCVNIKVNKDAFNIVFLMFLYFLQGIPLGLKASLPYILSSRKATYANQALFSLAHWPFSLKLLWAPIVDSVYSKSIGRRKSWLVPVQYLIGFFMLFYADFVHNILEQKQSITSEGLFFVLNHHLLMYLIF